MPRTDRDDRVSRLAIVQPYIAEYQRPFFELIEPALRERGIELLVLHGDAPSGLAARADAVTPAGGLRVASRELGIGSLRVDYKSTITALRAWRPDLVVLEQAQRHVETYAHALHSRVGGPAIAFWGHGRAYHRTEGPAAAWMRQALTMEGDWFFAYTRAGADYIIDRGFSPNRVTVLGNTIDTGELQRSLAAIDKTTVDEFSSGLALVPGRTALFLGGVDAAKGIPLLLESGDMLASTLPGFTLLVAGDGDLVPQVVQRQASGGAVRYLGRISGHAKALALHAADILAIPQGVGLVAVDSLVSGRPIVTTWGTGHGPEFEYLDPSRTCEVSAPTASAYATAIGDLLGDSRCLAAMQSAATADAHLHSLDSMAMAFVEGVTAWRDADRAALHPSRRFPGLRPMRRHG